MKLLEKFVAGAVLAVGLNGAQAGLMRTDVEPTGSNPSSTTIDTKSYGPVHMYKNGPKADYLRAIAVGPNGKVDMARVDCSDMIAAHDTMTKLDLGPTLEKEHRDIIVAAHNLCSGPN